ncbi:MAG: thiamine pyrophosphate-dependent enzyme, partial [Planctomycetota bacterium]
LSAAYTGVVGGFVVIACDDPGPYSSQTEQDSRLFALFAKVPVLDPVSPRDAKEMVAAAFELSERHKVPVIVRPTTRICHARQPVVCGPIDREPRRASFSRDPGRWAATPRFRFQLHGEVNRKLEAIRSEFETSPFNPWDGDDTGGPLGILAAGHAWATVRDVLEEEGKSVPVLRIGTPFPLPLQLVERFLARHERVLILEEPDFAIETQIPDRTRVSGRLSGHVPRQGELTPEVVAGLLGIAGTTAPPVPGSPPELCVACGHRAAFFAMRMALPKAIFCGDIGCYTLGLNQDALDTCLDMGASVTLAEGFFHAHRRDGKDRPVVAIIGDSTFFHAGMPALLNAVTNDARIIVVVLDNGVVAMTGAQPTPAEQGAQIETIARALGVRFIETIDPYEVDALKALLKKAQAYTQQPDGGVALVVARRPCALHSPPTERVPVTVVEELCTACDVCLKFFGCQPLRKDPETGKVFIDEDRCIDCAMCIPSCPHHAIVPAETA